MSSGVETCQELKAEIARLRRELSQAQAGTLAENDPAGRSAASGSEEMAEDITDGERAEEALKQVQEETAILNRIGRIFLSVPNDDMYADVLQVVLGVMKSPDGVFGYIDEDGASITASMSREIWRECQMPDKMIRFPRETWGNSAWSRALLQKRSICSNGPGRRAGRAPSDSPRAGGPRGPRERRLRPSHGGQQRNRLYRRGRAAAGAHCGLYRARPPGAGAVPAQERHRRQAEAALCASEEKFRAIANYTVDWENWLGADLELLWVSPSVERITAYSAAECYAMRDYPLPLIAAEDRAADRRIVRHAQGPGGGEDLEFRIARKDGTIRWVSAAWQPIYGANGVFLGHRAGLRDVTDSKRAEEELRKVSSQLAHLNRLHTVGEMAAALAHELNQPLYAINNYVRGIERRLKKQHALPDLDLMSNVIGHVSREVSRAAGIVANLRGFVRDHAPKRSSVDIGQLLQQAVALLRPLARDQSVTMELEVAHDLPVVQADPTQIEQVVVNLLANAVEAVAGLPAPRRKVAVSSRLAESGSIEIAVRDWGTGVPADIKDQVFEPFITTKENGLGVGLAISRSSVESHGGKIWVVDNEPHGAAFHFTIPLGRGQGHDR